MSRCSKRTTRQARESSKRSFHPDRPIRTRWAAAVRFYDAKGGPATPLGRNLCASLDKPRGHRLAAPEILNVAQKRDRPNPGPRPRSGGRWRQRTGSRFARSALRRGPRMPPRWLSRSVNAVGSPSPFIDIVRTSLTAMGRLRRSHRNNILDVALHRSVLRRASRKSRSQDETRLENLTNFHPRAREFVRGVPRRRKPLTCRRSWSGVAPSSADAPTSVRTGQRTVGVGHAMMTSHAKGLEFPGWCS